jgi:hypothetical protein
MHTPVSGGSEVTPSLLMPLGECAVSGLRSMQRIDTAAVR